MTTILVKALGDAANLSILGFFLDNPFDEYSVSEVAELAGVNRITATKYIEMFVQNEYLKIYIKENGKRLKYKINMDHPIIQHLDEFIDSVGNDYYKTVSKKEMTAKTCETHGVASSLVASA